MISPTESLAFSIHANPGVYAVLVGSGVSRPAKILTGWEITLDLTRKLAAVRKNACEPDPERWYQNTFSKEPDYSDLLDELCPTPAERQQLLRAYFEPTSEDPDEGAKQPTTAHHAIAALAAKGFIRVILTTNFDRLIETALENAGVRPVVLSTPDHVQGALPLIHTRCCVVKLHGDYLDTRIRNTRSELDRYSPEFDRLLDRIFDEFGLVVCGWSAAWDRALCAALLRAPSRRFTTYWAVRGELGDHARRLVEQRGAKPIHIADADDFLHTVHQHVESLRDFARPHPLSTEVAVASLKRYLTEPRYRIRLADLVDDVVERVIEATSGRAFTMDGPTPDTASVTARVRRYEAVCATLLALATVGGFWGDEEHAPLWQRALTRLSSMPPRSGKVIWLGLRRYPAALFLYALGIGAVASDRLPFLARLLETPVRDEHWEDNADKAAARVLPPSCLFDDSHTMRILDGMARRHVPLNDWMHDALRTHAARIVRDDTRYTFVFDKLETLIALAYTHIRPEYGWLPLGAFGYRTDNRDRIVTEITESLSSRQSDSPFVRCGIFGETSAVCRQRLDALRDFLGKARWGY